MALAVEPSFPWGTWGVTISQTSLLALSWAQWEMLSGSCNLGKCCIEGQESA